MALAGVWAAATLTAGEPVAVAQEWRVRAHTRVQYLEARSLVRDSVPIGQTTGDGQQRLAGDTLVSCAPGATFCYFYRPEAVRSTTPVVQDLDLSGWGFGVEGLRVYANVRLRTAFGADEFWPRTDDHFDAFAAYVELDRRTYRVRLGRDHQISGLGYYGYDGGSVVLRLLEERVRLQAYGGWGLERGLAEPVTSDALASLEEFQPRDRNLLFGFRGSARPLPGVSLGAIYQREIETDRSGITSERIAVDGAYSPTLGVWLRGHADYDLATGWWGKAGATVGWSPRPILYVEGRLFRYRPVFSLQTIWAAFSPTPYSGWGLSVTVHPSPDLSLAVEGERRAYGDTDADVPFHVTTDRTWRAGARGHWQPTEWAEVAGGYSLDFTFGAAFSAGEGRLRIRPADDWTIGVRTSAFQQLEEFRVGEGRVWSVGGELEWRRTTATLWASIDRYRHDRRGADAVDPDWTQTRAAAGLAFYLGSEPGAR